MEPEQPDMTSEEERRARLLEECEIPDLLASALDRHPDAWNVLWVQRDLTRLDAAEETIDPTEIKSALASLSRSDSDPIARRLRLRRATVTAKFMGLLHRMSRIRCTTIRSWTRGNGPAWVGLGSHLRTRSGWSGWLSGKLTVAVSQGTGVSSRIS